MVISGSPTFQLHDLIDNGATHEECKGMNDGDPSNDDTNYHNERYLPTK